MRHRVTLAGVLGQSRLASVVRARHDLWAMCRWSLGMSYGELGALFGVDHTTVVSAVRKCEVALNPKTEAAE
jgi:chromosomal replication initiation ATPase DnaA